MGRVAAFARASGVPVVATGEVAYLTPADHRLHEVLVAAANLTALPGPEYRPTDRLHLRSTKEMRRLFAGYPDALANAATVAERCAGTVKLSGAVHMPQAILPPGKTAGKVLLGLTVAGARRRYRKTRRSHDGGDQSPAQEGAILHRSSWVRSLLPDRARGQRDSEVERHPRHGQGERREQPGLVLPGAEPARAFLEPAALRALYARGAQGPSRRRPGLLFRQAGRGALRDDPALRTARGRGGRYGADDVAARGGEGRGRALGHSPGEINELSRHVPTRFRDRNRVYAGLSGWEESLAEPAMKGHPLQDERDIVSCWSSRRGSPDA